MVLALAGGVGGGGGGRGGGMEVGGGSTGERPSVEEELRPIVEGVVAARLRGGEGGGGVEVGCQT